MREALLLLLGEVVEKMVLMGLAKDGSEVGGAHSHSFVVVFLFVIADYYYFCSLSCLLLFSAALGALQATKS